MRTLLLLRHAKSDWDAPAGGDHERPLNKRGRKAAAVVGSFLARAGAVPDLALTSSAVRARTTVELGAAAGRWASKVEITPDLYETTPAAVLTLLQLQPAAAQTVLLAGHEPTWSSLASLLIGGGTVRMTTAAVAAIELDIESWAEVAPGRGKLLWLVVPRLLENLGLEA